MWKKYFPRGSISGIDLYDKSPHASSRIMVFKGSQDDDVFPMDVVAQAGPFAIIIDDGSHLNQHVIKTFQTLFYRNMVFIRKGRNNEGSNRMRDNTIPASS
jgi:hypothetical protein